MTNWPAWVSSGAAVAGAGAAWFATYNGVRTLRQTRTDSISRSRPMVAAEFRDAHPAHGVLYLVVRNYGPSIAKNVRVTFTPELPDPAEEQASESLIPFLKARYARPIPTLTPGTELSNVYFWGKDDGNGTFENGEDVPDQVTVTVTYESTDDHPYRDTFDLDVDLMRGATRVTSSTSVESQVRDGVKALKGIKTEATGIKQAIIAGVQATAGFAQPDGRTSQESNPPSSRS